MNDDIPPYIQRWCDEEGFQKPYREGGHWWGRRIADREILPLPFTYEASATVLPMGSASEVSATLTTLANQIHAMPRSLPQPSTLIVPSHVFEYLAQPVRPRILLDSKQPQQDAIEFLVREYSMKKPIAALRLKEFCERRHLSFANAYVFLQEGKIQVKKGVLCPGRGFPKAPPDFNR